jgi:hypothetical protein
VLSYIVTRFMQETRRRRKARRLVELLKALARKPAPFFVLDTHAGVASTI